MQKIRKFLQEAIDEIKKVKWPSRKQTVRLTAYVIVVSAVVGAYVSGLDFGFKEIISALLK